jgi:ubiquinone/menaquinone biosynthesis C-methylase UbiE
MNARIRVKQIVGWSVLAVFVAGFFVPAVDAWTGPILGIWFVGTQRLRRGFVWLAGISLVLSLTHQWRAILDGGLGALGLIALTTLLGVIPYTVHRAISPRIAGVWSTIPFPIAVVLLGYLRSLWPVLAGYRDENQGLVRLFLVSWLASALVWAWNREWRLSGAFRWVSDVKVLPWSEKKEAISLLESPVSGEKLHWIEEDGCEFLATDSGERYAIRDGMPVFLRPQDLTGQNLKYNHLYETIGGFYDDSQRVMCALGGMDRDAYVMSYLGLLEVKEGDRVLETSVGTGLNFKYLPRKIERFGLDLSAEMLAAARQNSYRWGLNTELFLGNAEALPFADEAFDVVFHVGGINFFSDRAKAIREMIRVARPGSRLLIADETEEHVKAAYENIPYTREFYKGRTDGVTAPVDLVPEGMEEVQLKILEIKGKKRFYALTFRKPAHIATAQGGSFRLHQD